MLGAVLNSKCMAQKIMTSASVENKTLSYSKGGVNVNFTFRVDIKQEMKDLVEILERARADILEQLATRFPKN